MGVVDRVHGHAAGLRALALPAVATGLADLDELELGVADLADGGAAVDRHATHLGARQAQGGEVALLGHELDARAGAAGHLAAAAGLELDVVDGGADRDVAQRQGVARADFGALAVLQRVADLHVLGGGDVGLLAVVGVGERDAAVAVGVVLDGGDLGRHAVLDPAEVDDAVALLVAATAVASGLAAVAVAATRARLLGEEGLLGRGLGDLREVGDRLEPTTGAGGLALAECHLYASNRSMRSPSARVTIARLVSGRFPKVGLRRLRVRLPLRLSVFTFLTLTPKMSRIASLISGLVESGWTRNVYTPCSISW